MVKERSNHKTKWTIRKYKNDQDFQAGLPFETKEIDGNILLNGGITYIWNDLVGSGAIHYDNANSRIGVGDSQVAEDANQTGLQATTNTAFKGMEAGYPSLSAQTLTFRAVFGGTEANFDWNEFIVDEAVTNRALNRKVSAQGTKASGQTWTVDVEITLS